MSSAIDVRHEPERRRFVAHSPEGDGELLYRIGASGALDVYHTGVDPQLRRRGIGEALVRAALSYARANRLPVIPTCPFVARWLEKHPEERDLVVAR